VTRLGVNIDHVATVRQARRGDRPDPVEAALEAVRAGADGITAHLREDRRHIQENDLYRLKQELSVPLNLEMAATKEILSFAEKLKPDWACLVPERRAELTTEGGLAVSSIAPSLKEAVARLHGAGVKVSFFIDPVLEDVSATVDLGADAVELHTGTYARLWEEKNPSTELNRLERAARAAVTSGLLVNAGHGLDYENVPALLQQFKFNEFNIGFSIVARSVFTGIHSAVHEMKEIMRSVCVEF